MIEVVIEKIGVKVNLKNFWAQMSLNNRGYKLMALAVTLVLWLTILGRRGLHIDRDFSIHYTLPTNAQFLKQPINEVSVRLLGTQEAIKKLSKQGNKLIVEIDLANEKLGRVKKKITSDMFDLPQGAQFISVEPAYVQAIIVEQEQEE